MVAGISMFFFILETFLIFFLQYFRRGLRYQRSFYLYWILIFILILFFGEYGSINRFWVQIFRGVLEDGCKVVDERYVYSIRFFSFVLSRGIVYGLVFGIIQGDQRCLFYVVGGSRVLEQSRVGVVSVIGLVEQKLGILFFCEVIRD